MDKEQEDGRFELQQVELLHLYLVGLKEKNNGTPSGRMWAIAATECEKLMAWIAYTITVTLTEAAS